MPARGNVESRARKRASKFSKKSANEKEEWVQQYMREYDLKNGYRMIHLGKSTGFERARMNADFEIW